MCARPCPVGHYCAVGTATPEICLAGAFCPSGSSRPRSLKAAHYVDASFAEVPCPAGFFCDGGVPQPCIAGTVCPNASSAPLPCDDPRVYCPPGESEPIPVRDGWYAVSDTAGGDGEELGQVLMVGSFPCGDPRFFCSGGERKEVQSGFFSVGGGGEDTRMHEQICPAGSVCQQGVRTPCSRGHYCPIGSALELPCGGTEFFCDEEGLSAPKEVGFGNYSLPEGGNKNNRTGRRRCEPGWFCSLGTRAICPVGSYCRSGIRLTPERGHYASGTEQRPCACGPDEHFESGNCSGASTFYCVGGLRRRIPTGFLPVTVAADEMSLVHAYRNCPEHRFCNRGEEMDCPVGHECTVGQATMCPEGQASTAGRCVACALGEFVSDYQCFSCPKTGAVDCESVTGVLQFKQGWWRNASQAAKSAVPQADDFYRCLSPSDCNVTVDSGVVTCPKGATGPLCATCTDDFFRFDATCNSCDGAGSTAIIVVSLLLVLILTWAVTRKSLHPDFEGATFAIIRIVWTHAMVANSLSDTGVDWGSTMRWLLSMEAAASGMSTGLLHGAFECSGFGYHERLLTTLLAFPLCVFVVPGFGIAAWLCLRRMLKFHQKLIWGVSPRDVWVNGSLSLIYLAYPVFVAEVLKGTHFNCYTPIDGSVYVVSDFRHKCEGGVWTLSAAIAYIELFTLVPLVPLLTVLFMRRNAGRMYDPAFRQKFLFMYGGYRPSCHAWEAVVMVRKVVVVLSISAFTDSVLQLCWLQIGIAVSLMLHLSYRPYLQPKEQQVETISLCSTLAIVTLGQAITMADQHPRLQNVLRLTAVVTNVITVLLFIYQFLSEARRARLGGRTGANEEGVSEERVAGSTSNPLHAGSDKSAVKEWIDVEPSAHDAGWDLFQEPALQEVFKNPLFAHGRAHVTAAQSGPSPGVATGAKACAKGAE